MASRSFTVCSMCPPDANHVSQCFSHPAKSGGGGTIGFQASLDGLLISISKHGLQRLNCLIVPDAHRKVQSETSPEIYVEKSTSIDTTLVQCERVNSVNSVNSLLLVS